MDVIRRTVRVMATAALVALSGACGGGGQPEMAGAASAAVARKRAAPADVPPITLEGVRYEVVHWGKARGLPQNGGYIAAVDVATGEELWLLQVYEIVYDSDMEGDKQDVFLTRMRPGCGDDCLELEDERGRDYRIDLASF